MLLLLIDLCLDDHLCCLVAFGIGTLPYMDGRQSGFPKIILQILSSRPVW